MKFDKVHHQGFSFTWPDVYPHYKYCKWSPDGYTLLSTLENNECIIHTLDQESLQLHTEWSLKEAECIYDVDFYPFMDSSDPATSCFLLSTRDVPLKLMDVGSGKSRASYVSTDHVDQTRAPNAVRFSPDGSKIYCGFNNLLQIFDTLIPGQDCESIPLTPTKKSKEGMKGIVSCIAFNPDYSGLYALGTFSGNIGLYDSRNHELLELKNVNQGLSQIEFIKQGHEMISVSRKSNEIVCWDLRQTGKVLYSMERQGNTNQRLFFSLDPSGNYLVTGDTNGYVSLYDLKPECEDDRLVHQFHAHGDVCTSSMFHPHLSLLATTSGSRHIGDSVPTNVTNDELVDEYPQRESQLSLWKLETSMINL